MPKTLRIVKPRGTIAIRETVYGVSCFFMELSQCHNKVRSVTWEIESYPAQLVDELEEMLVKDSGIISLSVNVPVIGSGFYSQRQITHTTQNLYGLSILNGSDESKNIYVYITRNEVRQIINVLKKRWKVKTREAAKVS